MHRKRKKTCSVLQLSRFRHRGDDPILILSETPSPHCFSATCTFHILRMERGSLRCVLQMSELQYRLGWFTVHWFHLPRDWLLFYFITSVWLWSIKETDTDLSDFLAFTSFTKSKNPQVHEFAYPEIYESTSQSSYLGVPPTPHCMLPTAFCTLYQGTRLALWCFASVKCFVVWLSFS